MKIIAVSSFKPFCKSEECKQAQILAKASWERGFSKIVYFNEPEIELQSPITDFNPSEDFPKTLELVSFAGNQSDYDWAVMVDADILLTLEFFSGVIPMITHLNSLSATSERLTYDIPDFTHPYKADQDYGIGIFVARPDVFKSIASICPLTLRVGHPRWDSWMTGAMAYVCGDRFVDFSRFNCVLHPKHEGRSPIYTIELTDHDERFANLSGMPRVKI